MSTLRFDKAMPIPVRAGTNTFRARVARTGDHSYGAGERGPNSPAGIERRDMVEIRRIVDQLPGKSVTLLHPMGLIKNGAKAMVIGTVARSWIDGEFAEAEFRVDHADGLHAISHRGMREVSLGYSTDSDPKGNQRNTMVDHLAIVTSARCGAECCVRTDHVCDGSGKDLSKARMFLALNNQLLASRKI